MFLWGGGVGIFYPFCQWSVNWRTLTPYVDDWTEYFVRTIYVLARAFLLVGFMDLGMTMQIWDTILGRLQPFVICLLIFLCNNISPNKIIFDDIDVKYIGTYL